MIRRVARTPWSGPLAAAVVLSGLVGWTVATMPTARADGVPYTDSNVVGTIGLCGKDGQLVRSGNINDHPFVFTAVSSEAAPSPYDAKGRKATLFAYQPRKDVVPGRWSGDSMTASSEYTNAAHPMTSGTLRDFSLADFLGGFPVRWDGLVQLRVYLGAPDTPIMKLPYPATDIRVSGDTWTVVHGGTGDCSVGKATSSEVAIFGTAPPSPSAGNSTGTGGKTSPAPDASSSAGASTRPADGTTAAGAVDPMTGEPAVDRHGPIILGGALVVLLVLGWFAFSWWRERAADL